MVRLVPLAALVYREKLGTGARPSSERNAGSDWRALRAMRRLGIRSPASAAAARALRQQIAAFREGLKESGLEALPEQRSVLFPDVVWEALAGDVVAPGILT